MKHHRLKCLADQPHYYVLLMFVALLLNYLDRSILAVLIVPLKAELGLSDTQVGFLTGFGFVFSYALIGLPLARLADRAGRHLIVGGGMILWSVSTAMCAFIGSMGSLLIARAGVGVGEAAGTGPSLALAGDQFSKERRPLALSFVNAGGVLGTALGLGLGGAVAQLYGWRTAFLLAGLPGLIVGLLICLTLRDRRPKPSTPEDSALDSMPGLQASVGFVARQRSILWTLLGSIFLGFVLTAVTNWSPSFFTRVYGLSLMRTGATLGLIKAACGVLGALSGGATAGGLARYNDRWQALVPALACLACSPAYYLFLAADNSTGAFVALGVGVFFTSAALGPVLSVYQCTTPPRLRSQITSLHILVASLGIGLGPLIVGFLNDHFFAEYGALALKSSLLSVPLAGLLAAMCYGMAGLSIQDDIARTGSI